MRQNLNGKLSKKKAKKSKKGSVVMHHFQKGGKTTKDVTSFFGHAPEDIAKRKLNMMLDNPTEEEVDYGVKSATERFRANPKDTQKMYLKSLGATDEDLEGFEGFQKGGATKFGSFMSGLGSSFGMTNKFQDAATGVNEGSARWGAGIGALGKGAMMLGNINRNNVDKVQPNAEGLNMGERANNLNKVNYKPILKDDGTSHNPTGKYFSEGDYMEGADLPMIPYKKGGSMKKQPSLLSGMKNLQVGGSFIPKAISEGRGQLTEEEIAKQDYGMIGAPNRETQLGEHINKINRRTQPLVGTSMNKFDFTPTEGVPRVGSTISGEIPRSSFRDTYMGATEASGFFDDMDAKRGTFYPRDTETAPSNLDNSPYKFVAGDVSAPSNTGDASMQGTGLTPAMKKYLSGYGGLSEEESSDPTKVGNALRKGKILAQKGVGKVKEGVQSLKDMDLSKRQSAKMLGAVGSTMDNIGAMHAINRMEELGVARPEMQKGVKLAETDLSAARRDVDDQVRSTGKSLKRQLGSGAQRAASKAAMVGSGAKSKGNLWVQEAQMNAQTKNREAQINAQIQARNIAGKYGADREGKILGRDIAALRQENIKDLGRDSQAIAFGELQEADMGSRNQLKLLTGDPRTAMQVASTMPDDEFKYAFNMDKEQFNNLSKNDREQILGRYKEMNQELAKTKSSKTGGRVLSKLRKGGYY